MAESHHKEPASKKRKSVDNNNNNGNYNNKKQNNKKKETFDGEDVQISSSELEETNYFFKDGLCLSGCYNIKGLRYVTPYYYDFNVYTKQRWIGRTLLDVFAVEFIGNTRENYEKKIARGDIKVNGKIVPPNTVLRDSDYLTHRVHRHEPPVVQTEIRFIENSDVVVVDKPSSIPVHSSGRYRHNSLMFILAKEYGMNKLYCVHRLDRLTSGVLIFTRTRELATKISEEMKNGLVKKEYLARVSGNFPEGEIEANQPIEVKAPRVGVNECKETGKPCLTKFQKLFYDSISDTSVVKCFPQTGRTHQIRVHLQYLKHPIHNDPLYGHSKVSAQRMEQPSEGTENFDSECLDCTNPHLDPEENQLVMWLHALSCRGTDWGYETKMPDWAMLEPSDNFNNNNTAKEPSNNNNQHAAQEETKT